MVIDTTRPVCYLATDPHQTDNPIVLVNDNFLHQTGYLRKEVIGRNPRFLQGADSDPEARRALNRAVAHHKEITVDILNYKKDGKPFWFRLRIRPTFSIGGRVGHFIGLHTAIHSSEARTRAFPGIRE